jgi:hypothetical protein
MRPVGRGTLLGMLRPKLEFPYERGADDVLGTVLRAVVVGRLKLPVGGRGTDRGVGEVEGVTRPDLVSPDLVVAPIEGPDNALTPPCGGRGMLWFIAIWGALRLAMVGLLTARFGVGAMLELPRLCGGRGTKRPAGAGEDSAVVCRPSGGRVAVGVCGLCEAGWVAVGLEEAAGGVIRLTVGREAADRDGRAAAFGPSMLSRVGDAFGLPIEEMFRKAPGEILAAFWATGNPRSRVFRETAVSAPGLVA